MSNLRDLIRLEIERGNMSEPFLVKDVRALIERNKGLLGGKRAPKDINSYLANHSTGPGSRIGKSVSRGKARLFIKHKARATYSIDYSTYAIELDSDPMNGDHPPLNSLGTTPQARKKKERTAPQVQPGLPDSIAELFVEYLKKKPYRHLETEVRRSAPGGLKLKWGSGPVTGWNNRLNQYQWKKVKWAKTKRTLAGFVAQLAKLEADWRSGKNVASDASKIYIKIKKWGNPSRGRSYSGQEILDFLKPLWDGSSITSVDSTLTKLYAFARPDDYVIYDSRVAAAIMTVAEDIYRPKTADNNAVVTCFRHHYPNLGLYGGSGGTRPRGYRAGSGWPPAYEVIRAQLDANDLCIRIRDCLNSTEEDGRSTWTLREVEAVLFMEGY